VFTRQNLELFMKWHAVLVVSMIALALAACAEKSKPGISEAIGALARDRNVTELHLSQAAPFAWDEVYLFGPYTPREQVCKTLRIPVSDCQRFIPFESVDDGDMTLAFMLQHCMARYTMHRRKNGDFLPLAAAGQAIAEERASFRVVRGNDGADGKVRIRLVQTPADGSAVHAR
jgi:hypothetical protein